MNLTQYDLETLNQEIERFNTGDLCALWQHYRGYPNPGKLVVTGINVDLADLEDFPLDTDQCRIDWEDDETIYIDTFKIGSQRIVVLIGYMHALPVILQMNQHKLAQREMAVFANLDKYHSDVV